VQVMVFRKGQSGNPAGKPRGARNRSTVAVEALLDEEGEAITRKVIELAKAGDTTALRLCLECIAPVRKGRPVTFPLPAIETTGDVVKAIGAVATALSTGALTPEEALTVAGVIELRRKAIETHKWGERLTALEANAAEKGR
jgi:hypothetical protein